MEDLHSKQRQKLSKIIAMLVVPESMSYSQYLVECTANGISPTIDNGPYFHWILCQCFREKSVVADNVLKLICKALREGWLLDLNNKEQSAYFLEACVDNVLVDKDKNADLYEAFFEGYDAATSSIVWKNMKSLNDAFAFTFHNSFKSFKWLQ